MRVAVVHNRDTTGVLNVFGMQNREKYNPKTVERVAAGLEKGGHNVRILEGNMHLADQLADFMPRVISGERPGMVFNMAYGIQGVSRYTHVPAMLEMLGVPYVGSSPTAHGVALDKVIAKMIFQTNGVSTPGFWNFASPDDHFDDLEFPVIVKPKMEAVSYGITVVHDAEELRDAVATIVEEFGQHVLVEQFIPGREFAVGLLGNGDPEVLPIVEFDLEGDPDAIQSADDKLGRPKDKIVPAPVDDDTATELRDLAKRAFRALDLYDFARIDVRMDASGRLYVLEINSMASLGLTGSYVAAAKAAGYTYEGLVNRMLDVAAVRYFGDRYLEEKPGGPSVSPTARSEPLPVRIRSYLRSQSATAEDLLARLVDRRSPADDPVLVNAAAGWVAAQFRSIGFVHQREHAQSDVGNVRELANHDGDHHDVVLLTHVDTQADLPFRGFEVHGNRLYGTGIADSKAGIVVALMALRALRFSRVLRRCRVGVLITTDDTAAGRVGRPFVEEVAGRSGVVLGLRAGGLDGSITTSRSGRASYRVRGSFDETGRGTRPERAAADFARRVLSVASLTAPDDGIRVAVTGLRLEAPFEHVPEVAEASISVRFNDATRGEEVGRHLEAILARGAKGVKLRVHGGVRRPPMVPTVERERLAADVAAIAEKLTIPLSSAHRWSSADICFVPTEVPALDGLGALGDRERSAEEFVLRSSLVDRAALLALAIESQSRR